jgi:hypothetical protein
MLENDERRRIILTAFTYSEFRCHALCVDYILYEKTKMNIKMASFKFFIQDLPFFFIQISFLRNTS